MKLLFATTNAGKLAELSDLLSGAGFEVLSLADFPGITVPEEDSPTLEGNAEKKARHYAAASKVASLADDSGLCVDALQGAPGVHSARYAEGSDQDRFEKLLRELSAVPDEARGAAFRCALCLALPSGRTFLEVGECRGQIARAPRGQQGFGYDPVFLLPSGQTMAELPRGEKALISHRGEALRRMRVHFSSLSDAIGGRRR